MKRLGLSRGLEWHRHSCLCSGDRRPAKFDRVIGHSLAGLAFVAAAFHGLCIPALFAGKAGAFAFDVILSGAPRRFCFPPLGGSGRAVEESLFSVTYKHAAIHRQALRCLSSSAAQAFPHFGVLCYVP